MPVSQVFIDAAALQEIEIPDASTTVKGLANFNSSDFTVESGAVSLVDLRTSHIAAGTLVTESEGIASNDNDTTLPTSAAVKDYADRSKNRIRFISANMKGAHGTSETFIPLAGVPDEKAAFGNEQVIQIMPTSGHVKEVIIRAHYSTYTDENITIKVYKRPGNKRLNGSAQVGSDITVAAPTQTDNTDTNTRKTGDLGTSYPFDQNDALGISFTWASTGPAANSDKTYITVVLEEDLTDLGY